MHTNFEERTKEEMLQWLDAQRRHVAEQVAAMPDQIIRAALAAMKRDERRAIAAAEAREIKDDPEDRAEIKAIQDDLAALQGTT